MNTATEKVLAAIRECGITVRRSGSGWSSNCPAHNDTNPSLSIAAGDDGRCLVNCHAGCETKAIVSALGLAMKDLMPRREKPPRQTKKASALNGSEPKAGDFATAEEATAALEHALGPVTKRWTYTDATGNPVGQTLRWETSTGKTIRPISRHGDRWQIKAMPAPRPLLHLPDLTNLPDGAWVYIVEGESCVDAARAIGVVATTSAGGSKGAVIRRVRRIWARAGVEPWARLWQTLRSSCEKEWAMTFPQYAVSKWIGHSIAISGRHYANAVPDELFDKAAEHCAASQDSAQRNAQPKASDRPRNGQKPNDNASQPESANSRSVQALRDISVHCESGEKWSRGESNPRALAETPEVCADSSPRAAPGAARRAPGRKPGEKPAKGAAHDAIGWPVSASGAPTGTEPPDIDLDRVAAAWAGLPEAVRRGIVAMVEGVG